MLQDNTTDNAIQLLINELESNGAQIIGRYDELFKGFSFRTLDNQTTDKIVDFLQENPVVLSILIVKRRLIQDDCDKLSPMEKSYSIILPFE